MQISEIVPSRLYLTSFEGVTNIKEVVNLKIDTIVTIMDFNPFSKSHPKEYENIKFVYYHAEDEDDFKISKYFGDFCELMVSDPNKRVLVHCYAGISRSATLVASYLIKNLVNTKKLKVVKKYNVERILASLKKKRQYVSPNNGFIKELNEFMKNLVENKENELTEIQVKKIFVNMVDEIVAKIDYRK